MLGHKVYVIWDPLHEEVMSVWATDAAALAELERLNEPRRKAGSNRSMWFQYDVFEVQGEAEKRIAEGRL